MSDFSDMADRISDFRDNWRFGTTDATIEAIEKMKAEVKLTLRSKNDSVARGQLLNAIDTDRSAGPADALLMASVTAPPWSVYLEYGTGSRASDDPERNHVQYPASYPPLEPIARWIQAKNIEPQVVDSRESLAYAIQQTLGENGQIPRPFMRPVWFSGLKGWRNVVEENHNVLKQELARL
jgi:hypothetical protein